MSPTIQRMLLFISLILIFIGQVTAFEDHVQGQVIVLIKENNLGDGAIESALQEKSLTQFSVKRLYAEELKTQEDMHKKRLLLLTYEKDIDAYAEAQALMQYPLVDYAEPNYIGEIQTIPNDPYWQSQWAPQKINLDDAYNLTIGSPEVVIAILDSGVDQDHQDLAQNLLPGYDFVNEDANPEDDNGHGTRMAGIAAAVMNNSLGVAGTCPSCKILPVKAGRSDGSFTIYDSYQALEYAANMHNIEGIPENPNPADVISMSFRFNNPSTSLENGVADAASTGAILLAGAGNDNTDAMKYPAAYEQVIAVAATDQNDARISISNYGIWVDIAAPGISIYTTTLNNGYTTSAGTSAATAMTAGLVGLMRSRNPSLDKDQAQQILQETASPVTGFPAIGGGRIEAYQAVFHTNTQPIFFPINDVTVTELTPVSIVAQGMDPDDQLTFTINDTRFQKIILPAQGDIQQAKFLWFTNYQSAGIYAFTITASDGTTIKTQEVRVTVIDKPFVPPRRIMAAAMPE
jgi:thermitase